MHTVGKLRCTVRVHRTGTTLLSTAGLVRRTADVLHSVEEKPL